MKILMLSPMPLWPVNAGDRVRIWQIAKGLARHAQVTLVVPNDGTRAAHASAPGQGNEYSDAGHPQPYRDSRMLGGGMRHTDCMHVVPTPALTSTRIRQVQSLLSRRPYHVALRDNEQIRQTVESLLVFNMYDLIYCHLLYTVPYAVNRGLPILLDQQNVDRVYWQRKLAVEPSRLRRWVIRQNLEKTIAFEERILPSLDGIVSVSKQDQQFMQGYAAPSVTHFLVAPNGVDTAHYRPVGTTVGTSPGVDRSAARQRLTLGFLGSMELALNQAAVLTLLREIYPAVRRQLSDWELQVLVIGRQPPSWLCNWAKEHQDPTVFVTGSVPDVLPYLHQVDLLILPLQSGAGTKLRVLEAMAAGLCIVGTPLAFDGLDDVASGEHVFTADDVQDFVEIICRLTANPSQCRAACAAARRLVERNYHWSAITNQLASDLQTIYGTTDAATRQFKTETRPYLPTLLP